MDVSVICLPHTVALVRLRSMLENVSGQKDLSCRAGCQEVGRCFTKGESEEFIASR